MWVHTLTKLIGLITYGSWPVCHYCHSAECLDRTEGTGYDCLDGCYQ